MECIEYIVTGHVQGVGFRYYTRQKATELQLDGWVQNEKDGTVRIYAFGPESKMIEFTKWCHHGPDTARVDKLEYNRVAYKAADDFVIKR